MIILPRVDYKSLEKSNVEWFRKSMEKYGYFFLMNSPIVMKDLLDLNSVALDFFKLPFTEKMRIYYKKSINETDGTGYLPLHDDDKISIIGEELVVGINYGEDLYPSKPLEFSMIALHYIYKMREVSETILNSFAKALQVPKYLVMDPILLRGRIGIKLSITHYKPSTEAPGSLRSPLRYVPNKLFSIIWLNDMDGFQVYNYEQNNQLEQVGRTCEDWLMVFLGNAGRSKTSYDWKEATYQLIVPEKQEHDQIMIEFSCELGDK